MNKKGIEHVYFDSCAFIEMIGFKHDSDRYNRKEKDRAWFCWRLLKASQDKSLKVFTSALTINECLYVKDKDRNPIDSGEEFDNIKRLFRSIFESGKSGVYLVELTPPINIEARDLYWESGIQIRKAMDRIHLATAIERGCSEFITIDRDDFLGNNKQSIIKLGITPVNPTETTKLPEKYKQIDSFDEFYTETEDKQEG